MADSDLTANRGRQQLVFMECGTVMRSRPLILVARLLEARLHYAPSAQHQTKRRALRIQKEKKTLLDDGCCRLDFVFIVWWKQRKIWQIKSALPISIVSPKCGEWNWHSWGWRWGCWCPKFDSRIARIHGRLEEHLQHFFFKKEELVCRITPTVSLSSLCVCAGVNVFVGLSCLTSFTSHTHTPALLVHPPLSPFSFSPLHPLNALSCSSDIAIMSGASVLDGSIGFGPSGLLWVSPCWETILK